MTSRLARRTRVAAPVAILVLALSGSTVAAVKPVASCPGGFELGPMTLPETLIIKNALGFPPEAVPYYEQLFHDFDKNGNGLLCLKDLPETPGIAASVFQLADDVASAR